MDVKKLITICQFGGEFDTNKDGTLSYNGGQAHAIDINHQTQFQDFKLEIADLLNCTSASLSIKYFLLGNKKTLINICNDRDFKRMISFNQESDMVDVYVTSPEIFTRHPSNLPAAASRSSRTTISEAPLILETTNSQSDNVVLPPNDDAIDSPTDTPIDSISPILGLGSCDLKHPKVPSSWENAITGVSQRFRSACEFREALRRYAVAHKFNYKCVKNDRNRVTVKCKSEGCPWRIHSSRLLTTQLFCIKRMNPTHTCERDVLTSRNHITTNWVAGVVKVKLQNFPKFKPKDIIKDIRQEYGLELNYYQARRGKQIAKRQLRDSYKEAYIQLPWLCERIKESNPGSFATFTTKEDSSFHRLFISFHASLNGFQQGCRPLLFLDNLHLNSKFQKSLLTATATDGDDGIFPVAFAVVDEETADNWHWFLTQLKFAVSTSRPITFVADMKKGLRDSIAEIFENGHHGYCLSHLSENFRKDLPTHFSNEVKRLLVADFYAAAYALKVEEFQRSIESIKAISPEAFSWIENINLEHWANAFFRGARYNHMRSSFGDSFYSWASEAYEYPITEMVHMIRVKMMELIYTRSVDSGRWSTKLTPTMEEKLQSEILKEDSLGLEVLFCSGSDSIFHVCGDSVDKVDIDQWICSCKGWQITGLPCRHAIAVFKCIGRDPRNCCSRYFTTESYRLTYLNAINPVPSVDILKKAEETVVVTSPPPSPPPPPPRRRLGRPKKFCDVSEESGKRKLPCRKSKSKGVENDNS